MRAQKGFTYIEVIVAMVVLGIVIIPISAGFVTATKNREQARHIYEATQKGQNLLLEIEEQIDKGKIPDIAKIEDKDRNLHSLFLEKTASDADIASFYEEYDKKYALEKDYSYEVAIWEQDTLIPLEELLETPTEADKNKVYLFDLGKALKVDLENKDPKKPPLYKMNTDITRKLGTIEDFPEEEIKWEVSKEMARAFIDTSYKGKFSTYEVPITEEEKKGRGYYGRSTITIEEDPNQKNTLKASLEDSKVTSYISDGSKTQLVKLAYSDGVCTITDPNISYNLKGSVNLVVDTTALDLTKDYKPFNIHFVNKSEDTLLVKVVNRNLESTSQETFIEKNRELNKKLVLSASKEQGKGNINIEYTDILRQEKTYLIGMIIRDKHPTVGKNYDIIKKMVTIHVMDNK